MKCDTRVWELGEDPPIWGAGRVGRKGRGVDGGRVVWHGCGRGRNDTRFKNVPRAQAAPPQFALILLHPFCPSCAGPDIQDHQSFTGPGILYFSTSN